MLKMKTARFAAAALGVELLVVRIAAAQGTIYLSNLGEAPVGNGPVGGDSWFAQPFVTGTNATGYSLNTVQLLMDAAVGSPSGFTAAIYSSPGDGPPIAYLGSLTGSDPAAGGIFSFASSGLVLSRSTYYSVVITAATPVSQGAYAWSAADSFGRIFVAPGDPWAIPDNYYSSTDGSSWTFNPRFNIFQLAIDATANAVPEPGVSGLLVFGGMCFLCMRWRGKPIP
jgi:hypothetical protein